MKHIITLLLLTFLIMCKQTKPTNSKQHQLKNIKIVALGDSITYGFPLGKGWPYFLAKNNKIRLINSGVNGETLEQFYNRIEQAVLLHQPEYCIVMGGTNDVAHGVRSAQIQYWLLKIITVLQKNKIKPIIGIPIHSTATEIEAGLIPFRDYLHQLNFPVIDFASIFMQETGGLHKIKSNWLPDTVHPSQQGYEAMSVLAYQRLNEIISHEQ